MNILRDRTRQPPDNRVLEAFFVLWNCPAIQHVTLNEMFTALSEAVTDERIVIEHGRDGWPIGFVIWESENETNTGQVKLSWFVALPGRHIGMMRALRHIHFTDRGISSYRRLRLNRQSVVCRWQSKLLAKPDATPSSDPAMTKEGLLFKLWGVEHWPGPLRDKITNIRHAVRETRQSLIERLGPIAGQRYVVYGAGKGSVVEEMSKFSPELILDLHADAQAMDYAAHKCKELAGVRQFHGDPRKLEKERETFDGALLILPSESADSLDTHVHAISSLVRIGGKIVIADCFAKKQTMSHVFPDTESIPSSKAWNNTFEEAGLEVESSDDLSVDAIGTIEHIIAKLDHLDSDQKGISELRNCLAQDLKMFEAREKSWCIWTLKKSKPPVPVKPSARPATTLVMLSGGIDSVYVLWDSLTNSDHRVISHHIHFLNAERRELPEARACKNIVRWLSENLRAFDYTESTIDRRGLRFFGYDMIAVGYEAGLAAQASRFGTNKPVDFWRVGSCLEEGGWSSRWPYVLDCCAASSHPFDPPSYLNLPLVTKQQQVDEMPGELVALTWGCRRPIWHDDFAKPCGKCHTCRDRLNLGLS